MSETEKHPGGRPRIYENPEDMQKAVDKYFAEIKEDDEKRPTVCGLALALGFRTRQSLLDYEGYDEEFLDILKKAKLKVEESYEQDLRTKGIKPTGPIFALKNMKWRDDKNFDHTTGGKPLPAAIITVGASDG